MKHFKEVGLNNVTAFNGVHGEGFGLKAVYPYRIDYPDNRYTISFKEVGIWLSHHFLWGALNLMWSPHFLILESDCKFPDDWHSRFLDAMNSVPEDFDMLYVGSCCAEDKPKTLVKNQVWDVRFPNCNHSYVVAKKALPMLLSLRRCCEPIDIAIAQNIAPKMKIYTVLPAICKQHDRILKP